MCLFIQKRNIYAFCYYTSMKEVICIRTEFLFITALVLLHDCTTLVSLEISLKQSQKIEHAS